MLRDAAHRSRSSFKQTLNTAIRKGLGRSQAKAGRTPFTVKAKALGLRPGLDPAGFNKLVDDLEVAAFLQKNREPEGE